VEIYTIGFTRKTAQEFFERIAVSGARSLTDVRRHPETQLSGFAKGRDLAYLLSHLSNVSYRREMLLAPSDSLLAAYRSKALDWKAYEEGYVCELAERKVESVLSRADYDRTVLLCSEATSEKCHRRVAVDYLARHWGPIVRVDL
jgi:uncharacterized protein (DUF488 family)